MLSTTIQHKRSTAAIAEDYIKKAGSFRLNEGVLLQFPYLIPFFPFYSTFLISTGVIPFLYLSFPSELSDTHAFLLLLAQPCAFLLFKKHSLKAMHFFTIKYFQVGYLFPSLDLNIL